MMRTGFLFFLIIAITVTVTVSCNKDKQLSSSTIDEVVVHSAPTFSVIIDSNVIYAKGLSHSSTNSYNPPPITVDLKLDIYKPDNSATNRPAIMLMHGGGFISGVRNVDVMVNLANYFSSRGWVAFSISYRLKAANGTVPIDWVNYAQNNLPIFQQGELYKAYPAIRDAKAALRWILANADLYKIDKNYITVGGGSAGAVAAITLGISEPEDYTNEIPLANDPTISTINKNTPYKIHTIVDFWGTGEAIDGLDTIYGLKRYGNNDAPIIIMHGTADPTFVLAEALRDKYIQNGVPYAFYPLVGRGHGPWDATVDGKPLDKLAFDFIVAQQKITVK